ncbi:MAG: hypothetical protein OSA99_13755, partial [Acidimicrobiales bacterium]|nr:hypothetical protein [Acidimicrobiales bacterium]
PEPTDLAPLSAAIADLRAHLADSRPDLAPLHAQLTSIAERVDQSTVEQRLEDLARTTDVSTLRQGVAEVIEAGAAQLEATERSARSLRSAIDAMAAAEPSPPDLDPVVRAIDSLRSHYDATQPDLDALIGAMTTLRSQILGAIESATAAHAVDVAPIVAQLVDGHQASESTLGSLRSQLEVLARTVDSIRSETRTSAEHLAVAAATVDIEPLRRSVDDLRAAIPAPVDLQSLREAIAHLADEIPPATDIGPVLAAISDVAGTIPPPADLGPVQAEVASVHDAVRSIDLAPLHERLETLPSHFPTLDLRPVEQALDTLRESMPATADLAPVHEAIAALRADLPQLDLGPVRRDVDDLRSTVAASQPDLSPIRESLSEVLDSLAQGITESRNATERVVGAVAGIEIPPAPDLAAARTDLTPVLAAIDGIDRRLDDTGATDRLRDAVRQVADDVASARADLAPSAAIEDLASRLDALQGAVDSLRSDDSLRETEVRLARRVDTNTEALRTKIDDQRALADSLAANVSQLNAALTVASEEPQQLRRDLDRILEQLAERMGGAMRELRNQLQSAEEPVALRSSVEAGLDRITGRFQTDTGRILEAVSAAQDDADGRLRRIDNQVTELRRAVERVRRDTDRFDVVSPS